MLEKTSSTSRTSISSSMDTTRTRGCKISLTSSSSKLIAERIRSLSRASISPPLSASSIMFSSSSSTYSSSSSSPLARSMMICPLPKINVSGRRSTIKSFSGFATRQNTRFSKRCAIMRGNNSPIIRITKNNTMIPITMPC